MRIAMLGPYPTSLATAPDTPALPGGVDAVVLALVRGLARRPGVQLTLVTAVPGLSAPRQTQSPDGYAVWAVPRSRGGRLTGQRQVVRALLSAIHTVQPDVVHAHIAGIYAHAALRSGLPACVTLHGIIWREMQQAWATSSWPVRLRWLSDGLVERQVVRQACDLVAISPYVVDEFRAVTQARFHTIENPVDDRFFTVAAPSSGADRLLAVGRVIPRKGILGLLRAFALVVQQRPAAQLTIVGELESEPAYVAACRALAAELGVSRHVTFRGGLPPEKVLAEYGGSDLVVLASEQETAPVSIAEAMAAGRPVVATRVGGCAAMVTDGVSGRIAPPRAPEAFAAAVLDLLNDDRARLQMAAAARRTAEERFRLDSIVASTVALYETLAGKVL